MNFEKAKLVTHLGCLDGSTTAILFLHLGGKKENILFTNPEHQAVDATAKEACENFDGELLLVDVSVSMECAEWLNKRGSVLLLDHHKSAIPLSKYSWCNIEKENKRCGSRMMFEYFKEKLQEDVESRFVAHLDLLTTYVDDYDRWQKKYPQAEKYTQLMNFLGQEMFINRFFNDPSIQLTDNEKYVLNVLDKKNKETIRRKVEDAVIVERVIDGKICKVGLGVEDHLRSELGNAFIEELGVDLAIIANASRVSFRSSEKSGIDCSKFAQKNGGAGHRAAAGSSIKNITGVSYVDHIDSWLKY